MTVKHRRQSKLGGLPLAPDTRRLCLLKVFTVLTTRYAMTRQMFACVII